MGLISCTKKSIRNHRYSLRNNPAERRSQTLSRFERKKFLVTVCALFDVALFKVTNEFAFFMFIKINYGSVDKF